MTIMPKDKSSKLKGCVCNASIDKSDIKCNLLYGPADTNDIVIAKLKRKEVYCCHALLETVRPSFARNLLEYQLSNTNISDHLNSQIGVNMNNMIQLWIWYKITALSEWTIKEYRLLEQNENPLAELRLFSKETAMIEEIALVNEIEEAIAVA